MYNGNKERLDIFLNTYSKEEDENGCRIWTGAVDKLTGYGITSFIDAAGRAHRVAYILAYGNYPKRINGRKICIRHLCHNKLCVNPKHLALGTFSDNNRDSSMAGKGTKMTLDTLTLAVKLRKEGLTHRKIGNILSVSEVVISHYLRGKSYYCRELLKKINV